MYIQRKVANMKSRLGTSKLHLKSVKENLKVKHVKEYDELKQRRKEKENNNAQLSNLEKMVIQRIKDKEYRLLLNK